MRILRSLTSIFCVLSLLACVLTISAFAAEANIEYTGNSGELILEPGSEHSPTDLFPNFKNVVPGASLTQKITVRNKADDKVKVKIFLRSYGSTDEKYNEFLNKLRLTVKADEETPLFDDAADKADGLSDWVCIGTLYSGATVDLNVTLDVPADLDNTYQDLIGKIKWQFVTEELPLDEKEWDCPECDEPHSYEIKEEDGKAYYVCDHCGHKEAMLCEICDGNMHEVIIVVTAGQSYVVRRASDNIYKTEDGRAEFHFNDERILEYYIVDGKRINIKSINEYTLYAYYECVSPEKHKTEPVPVPPKTGDDSDSALWIGLMAGSIAAILVIFFLGRKKKKEKEDVQND